MPRVRLLGLFGGAAEQLDALIGINRNGEGGDATRPGTSVIPQRGSLRCRTRPDANRGYDHGAFVPLMVSFPSPPCPVVQLSLLSSLDPAAHLALGAALAPLRDENTLLIASGMSFHNLSSLRDVLFSPPGGSGAAAVKADSERFDSWLSDTLTTAILDASVRAARLLRWAEAPGIALLAAFLAVRLTDSTPQRAAVIRERSIWRPSSWLRARRGWARHARHSPTL